MFEDGKTSVARRRSPRIRMTVRAHTAHWVATSPARRVVASIGVAAIISAGTFGACQASDFADPNFKSRASHATSKILAADGSIVDDEDSDSWPMTPTTSKEITPEEAEADPDFVQTAELQTPVTEAVYNRCRGELVVLHGYQKTRTRIEMDPFPGIGFRLQRWNDTRNVFGAVTIQEDYWDDESHSWKKRDRVVKYHNTRTLLDKFDAGPVAPPLRSAFQVVIYLQREGFDGLARTGVGNRLIVHVKWVQKVDRNGNVRTEDQLRAECN